jgi:transcriptional regulator with XRE-family HTH domain
MMAVYHVPMSTSGTSAEGSTEVAPKERGTKPKGERKVTFLTQRLDHLFETVHPKSRGPYSYQEVADAILEVVGADTDGKAPISPSYIWQLRSGMKENPTRRHIALLAAFFDVSPLYFFEDTHELGVEQIELDRILQDPKVHALSRAAAGLSDASLDAVLALVESLHGIESEAHQKTSAAD